MDAYILKNTCNKNGIVCGEHPSKIFRRVNVFDPQKISALIIPFHRWGN